MKTLKDLGEKHYSNIHYSFDVYYYPGYDDMYVGNLTNILKINGYSFKLNAPTIEELVKKADQALEIFKTSRVDDSSMEQMLAEFNYNNNKN